MVKLHSIMLSVLYCSCILVILYFVFFDATISVFGPHGFNNITLVLLILLVIGVAMFALGYKLYKTGESNLYTDHRRLIWIVSGITWGGSILIIVGYYLGFPSSFTSTDWLLYMTIFIGLNVISTPFLLFGTLNTPTKPPTVISSD